MLAQNIGELSDKFGVNREQALEMIAAQSAFNKDQLPKMLAAYLTCLLNGWGHLKTLILNWLDSQKCLMIVPLHWKMRRSPPEPRRKRRRILEIM
uniref:Tail tape measure n=1 Tax=Salmonella phage vB_SE130_2P TaxID=3236707 RepID=A0AB39C4V7_9VIRU